MEQTSHGNWSGTSHTLTIMGVVFSVHFEKHDRNSAERLYFNGFDGNYFDNEELETAFGRIPTGYICLEELKEKFPEARITCNHTTCKVHRENGTNRIDLDNTIVQLVPTLKQQVFVPGRIFEIA